MQHRLRLRIEKRLKDEPEWAKTPIGMYAQHMMEDKHITTTLLAIATDKHQPNVVRWLTTAKTVGRNTAEREEIELNILGLIHVIAKFKQEGRQTFRITEADMKFKKTQG